EKRACSEKPWWTLSENFNLPLVFYMEEDQEERIFGHLDADLHCIGEHSHTLTQRESWFTDAGHVVTVVGPPETRGFLLDMIWSLGSWNSDQQAQGLKMLQLVWSQPLTKESLAVSPLHTAD
uniref:KH-like RNA-binding domain-containing protein n=1 Tax=Neovison vison TaxID=452646 RepID=A0A8C7BLL8_NEOVI